MSTINIVDYCSFSVGSGANDDWIQAIHIKDQDENVLLDVGPYSYIVGGHRDNTNMVIVCNPGDVLTISVTVNAGGSNWTQALSWGHTIDSEDLVTVADLHIANECPWTHTYDWTVPNEPGIYLIAWWENYNGFTTGCGAKDYAERHSYTLHILAEGEEPGEPEPPEEPVIPEGPLGPGVYQILVEQLRVNDGYPFLQWHTFAPIAEYMGLDYLDLNLTVEKPKLHLTKPDKTIVGILESAYNINLKMQLGGINELTFNMPYKVDINNLLQEDPNINKIKDFYLIKMVLGSYSDWYIIQPTTDQFSDSGDEKSVTCYNLSHELSNFILKDYSRVSYTPFQVLDEVLSTTAWRLGYISPILRYKHRTYEVSSKTFLNFLLQDMAETLNCYVFFDTENRLVHLVDPDEVGINRGLIFSYHSYLKTLNRSVQLQEFATHFKPYGKNSLMINDVNPTGQNYIFDYSYFLYPFERDENKVVIKHSDYMSDELAHAILDYNELIEGKKGIELVAGEGSTNTELILEGDIAVDDYVLNKTRGYVYRKVLEVDESVITINIIEDQTEGDIIYLYKNGSFRKLLFAQSDLKQELSDLNTTLYFLDLQKTLILDRVEVIRETEEYSYEQIEDLATSPYAESFVLDDTNFYMLMLKITTPSVGDYTVAIDGAPVAVEHDTWQVLSKIETSLAVDIGITFTGTLNAELIWCKITDQEFHGFDVELQEEITDTDLLDRYNDYYKTEQIEATEENINTVTINLGNVTNDINDLRWELSRNNPNNFSADETQELLSYIKEKEWSNGYLFDGLDLYEEAIIAFGEVNKPEVNITIDIVNFLECIEEQHNWDKLNLGDFVRIKYDPFKVNSSNARIMGLDYSFDSQDVKLTLSNPVKNLLNDTKRSMRMFAESIKSRKILDSFKPVWDNVSDKFSNRNNRITTVPTIPEAIDVNHIINTDGTANINIEWSFDGDGEAYKIDGFIVYARGFENRVPYIFGSGIGKEQIYTVGADKNAYTIYGVPCNKFFYFGVQAYRNVDTDINPSGILRSRIKQTNVYQPETEVIIGSTIPWSNVNDKPSTFSPSTHGNTSHSKNYASDFLELEDTAANYTGSAGKAVIVNSLEDGLEFGESGVAEFLELNDTPEEYTGQAGKAIIVKSTEDGLEFGVAIGGGGGANYNEIIGDNTNTIFTITHGLDNESLIVALWNVTGIDPILATEDAASIEVVDSNNIKITFGSAPATNSYNVVVVSGGSSAGAAYFPELLDTPVDYIGHGGKILKVKSLENGIEFIEDDSYDLEIISILGA